jgi:excisionase family DNA binding protein
MNISDAKCDEFSYSAPSNIRDHKSGERTRTVIFHRSYKRGPPMDLQLLDAKQLGALLNISEGWLKRKARAGEIPFIRLGKAIRFRRAEVEKWLEGQKQGQ